MARVELESIGKSFGETAVLSGIDLDIADGEFLTLVGPSGCGKSTLIRIIAGLEPQTSGRIRIGGAPVDDLRPHERRVAMVFQSYALYPHMSVFANMALPLTMQRLSPWERLPLLRLLSAHRRRVMPGIAQEVRSVAAQLQIEPLLHRRPAQLSGGQRQRVALGRAMVRHPGVFLMDEPLSNLDAKLRVHMRSELTELHQRLKSTFIYVTHDQVEAMTMGDRIAVMKDGHIMQVADPLTLYSRPANAFVAGFIGSPPMNLLKGKLEKRGSDLTFVEEIGDVQKPQALLRLETEMARRLASYAGKAVLFGIRPEDIEEQDGNDYPGATLRVVVDVSEPMGADTMLYVESSSHTLIARAQGYRNHVPDEEIQLVLDMKKAHVFDAETEQSLMVDA
jgi:ABC-type sugar transport system ATPase subunit